MKCSVIRDVVQGSDEWFELRAKRMTTSHSQAIGNCGTGLDTYIIKKLSDYYYPTGEESYMSDDMLRGNNLENEAGITYAWEHSVEIEKIGFVIYNDYVGSSPDLYVNKNGIAEIKCPKDSTYLKLLFDEKIDIKYLWQMNGEMLVCEKEYCDFVAYNPNFEQSLFVERIFPDKKMVDKLLKGFEIGEKLMDKLEDKIKLMRLERN